ncbi:MAG: DUF5606 domain-containing protein [Bacteroidia bacterium]|nr:DUF5606 domain-containing protein [Bacteroidia bacterium]
MKKINLDKIIAISGTPGLYKVISQGTKGVIVENIIDKKRTIVLNNNKIYSLDSIRIFVQDGEKPIEQAMYNLFETLDGKPAPHHKSSSDEEIKQLFEKAISDYDRENVSINNMRKLIQWYNTLQQANLLEVVEETPSEEKGAIENSNKQEVSETPSTNSKEKKEAKTKAKKTSSSKEINENTEEPAAPKKRGRKKKSESENE